VTWGKMRYSNKIAIKNEKGRDRVEELRKNENFQMYIIRTAFKDVDSNHLVQDEVLRRDSC
jgi:hypothetical protein